MPAKKYKRPRQRVRDELDKLVSELVRWRDGYQCFCGERTSPSAGHVIPRGNYAVRWDLMNVHVQCSGCNQRHNYDTAPYLYWVMQRFGVKAFSQMLEKASMNKGSEAEWSVLEMQEELERLTLLFEKAQGLAVYSEHDLINLGLYGRYDFIKPLGKAILSRGDLHYVSTQQGRTDTERTTKLSAHTLARWREAPEETEHRP